MRPPRSERSDARPPDRGTRKVDHTHIGDVPLAIGHERARPSQILDRFVEESWRSIYAGQLEMRPPGAPTIEPDFVGLRSSTQLLVNTLRLSVVVLPGSPWVNRYRSATTAARRPGLRALCAAPPAPLDPAPRSWREAFMASKLTLAGLPASVE